MEVRHQFDYDTYTAYDMDDEETLRKVLEESLKDQ